MINKINSTFPLRRTATVVALSIVTLTVLMIISGALLAFNYQPVAGGAYQSLEVITTHIRFGWIFCGVHNYAGNFVIVLGLIQIAIMFLGRQLQSNWLIA